MTEQPPGEATPILRMLPKGAKEADVTQILDRAGNAIVEMLRGAADKAKEDCTRAVDSVHRISQELQAAEDRARTAEAETAHLRDRAAKAEAEVAHFRDRATKAEAEAAHFRDRATKAEAWLLRIRTQIDENWLLRIRNEIDDNFFQEKEFEQTSSQSTETLPVARGGNPSVRRNRNV
jgi:chromosome segregation ATPase